jgi:transcriptional regulator with GAF, ATPase, and Fis domain
MVFTVDGKLAIGRDDAIGTLLDDDKLSRHHAEILHENGAFEVRDLGSRNGTFTSGTPPLLVRTGGTLTLLVYDASAYVGKHVREEGELVIGAAFGDALAQVERAGRASDALLIRGETGTGKEIAARTYHEATGRRPERFTAFNCAAIPEGIAERLLFGARRGAYSGANADAEGVVQAADGGTLFLDEIGELDVAVQAKLLRVLETHEVLPLGAPRPRKVDVRFCFATHRDLRSDVAEGRFREDLFYRLGDREVVLPALRARREDVPWLLAAAASDIDPALKLHPKLVEACMLRAWPGNVRELLREGRRAAETALEHGDKSVRVEHLRAGAGEVIERDQGTPDLKAALGAAQGNISEAARSLGMHRTQLRRQMRKLGLTSSKT